MEISRTALVTVVGVLGNIISVLVCIAPIPTFVRIHKRKSSEGYQSIPYVISLFSAMLWIYYALVRKNAILLIGINIFSCVLQMFYICFYLYYAPQTQKTLTVKLFLLVDVFAFGLIFLLTHFLTHGNNRVEVLGKICMVFSLCVFVAPLGIIESYQNEELRIYVMLSLPLILTLSAIMWFFYGLLLKDMNIALPNVFGFLFGVIQMLLYLIYKKPREVPEPAVIELESQHVSRDILMPMAYSDGEERKDI